MKKSLIGLISLFIFTFQLNAQDVDFFRSNITVNAALSREGMVFDDRVTEQKFDVASHALPAFQINYEYFILKLFSVGAGVSIQKMWYEYNDWKYVNDQRSWTTVDFTTNLYRANAGVKFHVHWYNTDNYDFYAGIRAGYTQWKYVTDCPDPNYDLDNMRVGDDEKYSFQVIAFGLRAYLTDNIGISSQLAFGAPHALTFGFVGRF